MQLVIAEKPSVARDIARALGVTQHQQGSFYNSNYVITWCIGHLVELVDPAEYNERWKYWRLDTLPMIPEKFKLRPNANTKDQWHVVRGFLRSGDFEAVINACDAGREGELIFRYCYELAGSRIPAKRLWVSSMTDTALRAGFAKLAPASQYDPLARAARCRSEADWLVGLNATRALTLSQRTGRQNSPLLSVGRVQTPTLAMIVQREKEIASFVPQTYYELTGRFETPLHDLFSALYTFESTPRLGDKTLAETIQSRCEATQGTPFGPRIEKIVDKKVSEPPPLLFDLTSLQRTANRRYGFSAQHTLDIAQALYEKHKLLTYPRTDSRHLNKVAHPDVLNVLQMLANNSYYSPFASPLVASPPGLIPRVFNDKLVSDHHAIIPTTTTPSSKTLSRDEGRIYDLVTRRFLGAFYPDAQFATRTIIVLVGQPTTNDQPIATDEPDEKQNTEQEKKPILKQLPPPPDRFIARGRTRLVAGWQDVAGINPTKSSAPAGSPPKQPAPGTNQQTTNQAQSPPGPAATNQESLPSIIKEGDLLTGTYSIDEKVTRPPARYTEASILGAMETAGKSLDEESLRAAMKDTGLGTPATRASTLETLLHRGYLERNQKNLVPTALGQALIDCISVSALTSAELTGQWEARLARMARNEEDSQQFKKDINTFVGQMVKTMATSGAHPSILQLPETPQKTANQSQNSSPKAEQKAERPAEKRAKQRTKQTKSSDTEPTAAPPKAKKPREKKASTTKAPQKQSVEPTATEVEIESAHQTTGPLICPNCQTGTIIKGKTAWGCTNWKNHCPLRIPFELAGRTLSDSQLRSLITTRKTRAVQWVINDQTITGSLVLILRNNQVILEVIPTKK